MFGQYFFEDGRKVGANVLANQSFVDTQEWPSVTALKTGGFFVAYESEGLDDEDGGIGGRLFSGITVATLTGSAADLLQGDGGDDLLRGGAGADRLDAAPASTRRAIGAR